MTQQISNELKQEYLRLSENLLTSEELYDCTFHVGPTDTMKEFHGVKALLANMSDVFKAQLYGKFQEASQHRDNPILLPNCNPNAFACILRASCGLDPNITESNVIDLIIESKYYNIAMLVNECCKWMQQNINSNNVLRILNEAYLRGLIQIKNNIVMAKEKMISDLISVESFVVKCLDVLFDNSKQVLKQEYFWKLLHVNVLIFIISKDYFLVDEEKLWDVLIKWAKQQATLVGSESNKSIITGDSINGNSEGKEMERGEDEPPPRKRIKLSENGDSSDEKIAPMVTTTNCNKTSTNEDLCLLPTNLDVANETHNERHRRQSTLNEKSKIFGSIAFRLIQSVLKYVRFTRMSSQYFGTNVKDWLYRNDLEFLMLRVCCGSSFQNEATDWINYNARKNFKNILKDL